MPNTYYVDASRPNDTGNGLTLGAAWKTIQHAINTVAAGDTVNILAGTYAEYLTTTGHTAGTAGNPITFQAYGNGNVIIQPAGAVSPALTQDKAYYTWSHLIFDAKNLSNQNCVTTASGADHVIFAYCTFYNHLYGTQSKHLYLNAATDCLMYNCIVTECQLYGIDMNTAATVTFRNCIISGCGSYDVNYPGLNVRAGCTADLDYCLLSGNGNTYTGNTANAGTLTDGGHNITNNGPLFTKHATGKCLLGFCVDDFVEPYSTDAANAAAAEGVNIALYVIKENISGHEAALRALNTAGHELGAHGNMQWTQLNAVVIRYVGAAASATAAISGNTLALTSANGEDHAIDLTSAPNNEIGGLITTISGYTGVYTASLATSSDNNAMSIGLADLTATDIKTANVTLLFDTTRVTQAEINTCVSMLQAAVPGVSVTTTAYPGGSKNATVMAAARDAGMLLGRGTLGTLPDNLSSVAIYDVHSGAVSFNGSNESDTRARARWLAEYMKARGAVMLPVCHNTSQLSIANWGYLLNELKKDSNVTIMTPAQIAANIRADHSTADSSITWTKTYPDVHNFNLLAGSAAIDTGTDLGAAYKIDMAGRDQGLNGAGWEMGTYVYSPSGMEDGQLGYSGMHYRMESELYLVGAMQTESEEG